MCVSSNTAKYSPLGLAPALLPHVPTLLHSTSCIRSLGMTAPACT